MPRLFSEEDRAWLEDIAWDLEETVNEACDFVLYVVAIGLMSQVGQNVEVATRDLSYPSFHLRPAVLNGLPDQPLWV